MDPSKPPTALPHHLNVSVALERAAVDEEDTTPDMPLSPSSVRHYQKGKASKGNSDAEEEEEENSHDDKDDKGRPVLSQLDIKDMEARLEALDGTSKLHMSPTEARLAKHHWESSDDDAEEEDDDDEEDGDEEDDDDEEEDDVEVVSDEEDEGALVSELSGTSLNDHEATIERRGAMSTSLPLVNIEPAPSRITDSPSASLEPAQPRISLPCFIETATNPPRTRITLRHVGNSPAKAPINSPQKTTTRGHRNYMVATDLSGESWHATEWAIKTILRNGDELNVVTIVEEEKDTNVVKKGVQAEMREDAEKLTKNIHEQLERTKLRDITVVIHIVAATKAVGAKELLIEMIDDLEDLSTVIVGSRGRGAIKGLLLGSISNFLVHNSSVPVMVVRAPKKSGQKKKGRKVRTVEHTRSVREANMKLEAAFKTEDDMD